MVPELNISHLLHTEPNIYPRCLYEWIFVYTHPICNCVWNICYVWKPLHRHQNLKQSFVGWNRACLHSMSHIDGPAKGSIDLGRLKNVFQFARALIQYIGLSFSPPNVFDILQLYNENTEWEFWHPNSWGGLLYRVEKYIALGQTRRSQ